MMELNKVDILSVAEITHVESPRVDNETIPVEKSFAMRDWSLQHRTRLFISERGMVSPVFKGDSCFC